MVQFNRKLTFVFRAPASGRFSLLMTRPMYIFMWISLTSQDHQEHSHSIMHTKHDNVASVVERDSLWNAVFHLHCPFIFCNFHRGRIDNKQRNDTFPVCGD